jgi:hypothetical protein
VYFDVLGTKTAHTQNSRAAGTQKTSDKRCFKSEIFLRFLQTTICNPTPHTNHLKDKSSTLGLLFTTQFEMLASFQWQLSSVLALVAFQTQDNLLGGFSLVSLAPPRCPLDCTPSCGKQVLSDHRNHSVSCHIVAYPAPRSGSVDKHPGSIPERKGSLCRSCTALPYAWYAFGSFCLCSRFDGFWGR